MYKELELYELVLLMTFTSTEQETLERIDYYRDYLTRQGSQVMVKNNGKKQLAYPIKGFNTTTYIQIVYLGNGNLVNSIKKEIQRDPLILRSVTTKFRDTSALVANTR
tara:strand:+ start:812 stop:1135 length:324 start_codon:yes stop_codon:yes gene_type:complete